MYRHWTLNSWTNYYGRNLIFLLGWGSPDSDSFVVLSASQLFFFLYISLYLMYAKYFSQSLDSCILQSDCLYSWGGRRYHEDRRIKVHHATWKIAYVVYLPTGVGSVDVSGSGIIVGPKDGISAFSLSSAMCRLL